jgi:thiamine biosynthesis protein ThiI
MVKKVYILRLNEIFLKSERVAKRFYNTLIKQLKLRGIFNFYRKGRRLYSYDGNEEIFKKIFGIESISYGYECKYDLDMIVNIIENIAKDTKVKIQVKRITKDFPMKSPEITKEIISRMKKLTPSLESDYTIYVDFHQGKAYVYDNIIKCFGGLPVGVQGEVVALLSGGIDSPVASLLAAKRGCNLNLLHFLTDLQEYEKIIKLYEKIKEYCPESKLIIIKNYNEYLSIIREKFGKATCFLCKYSMYKIASKYDKPIITGDNLGQVASQTLEMLYFYSKRFPIFRPLLTYDKNEIVALAREFGTYDISISTNKPCLFVPNIVVTKPPVNYEELIKEIDKIIEQFNFEIEII